MDDSIGYKIILTCHELNLEYKKDLHQSHIDRCLKETKI